ncbi:hypothetical protein C1X35_09300 [Pseudomonas sp. FW306-1C-G01A]|nr:hypothetical protein [Pseudomonas mandelii]PMV84455.1 hypothetical protein C1X56_23005 [Pseudomonas sp. GW101-1A09]PMV98799.1 hypothetical protein C1X51_02255 [Pseudomonas sp. FW306-2-2C-B10A]PMW01893.1 hypothetical protein C1X55_04275 [Pseudomonas sp. GW460-C8]PMW11245.1 hypothetical protein C1X52_21590 [Pseudomonas sp. FW306-2-1A-C05A]PMW11508.1 hypothetical protein C1X40_28135 [Pseudomonas sp. GW456-11-11-14-TSB2]PMW24749.1 hypothetical protein C1X53_09200 [Pseudomonas sp. GW456-E6]PMW
MWRGSLLPPGCVAAPKNVAAMPVFVSATHSSGSKLPRHRPNGNGAFAGEDYCCLTGSLPSMRTSS